MAIEEKPIIIKIKIFLLIIEPKKFSFMEYSTLLKYNNSTTY